MADDDKQLLYLWIWEDVLEDCSTGIAFAFALDESQAWDELKKTDRDAWCRIRERPRFTNDPREPTELPNCIRPTRITHPSAYTCWG